MDSKKCPECGAVMVYDDSMDSMPWTCPKCGVELATATLSGGTGQAPKTSHDRRERGRKQVVDDLRELQAPAVSAEAPAEEAPESVERERLAKALRKQPSICGSDWTLDDTADLESAAALIERDGEYESALRELVEATNVWMAHYKIPPADSRHTRALTRCEALTTKEAPK